MRRLAIGVVAAALATGPACAQEAGRADDLAALAGALGQSQALREACEGMRDQYWRSRMMRLLEIEPLAQQIGPRLTQAFNAGYAEQAQAFPACGPESRAAEAAAAERGRAAAVRLLRPGAGPT